MHFHEVMGFQFEIWTQTILKIRLKITEIFYFFNEASENYTTSIYEKKRMVDYEILRNFDL